MKEKKATKKCELKVINVMKDGREWSLWRG